MMRWGDMTSVWGGGDQRCVENDSPKIGIRLGVEGRIGLKIHFKKRNVEMWTGLWDQKQR
jgi:hypothetical protein